VIFHLIDWFKRHAAYYRGLVEHPRWREVRLSQRGVAHTLWHDPASNLALLHLVNHHYSAAGMAPVVDLQAVVPVDHVLSAKVISPDFDDELPLSFASAGGVTTLSIPELEFYDVVVMEYETPADSDAAPNDGDVAVDGDASSVDDDVFPGDDAKRRVSRAMAP
jgi:hypothetical protein